MSSVHPRKVKEITHLWKLEQLHLLLTQEQELRGPKIYVSASNWLQFCLDSEGSNSVTNVIRLSVKNSRNLNVSLLSCDVTQDDLPVTTFKPVQILSLSLPGWKFMYSYNLERVRNGRFEFFIRLFVAEKVDVPPFEPSDIDFVKLSRDCGRLLDTANNADLTLEASNGDVFEVHRAILAVRCPELLRMLNVVENESSPQRRVLYTVPGEVLKVLLGYFYHGKLQLCRMDLEEQIRKAINAFKLENLMSKMCAYPCGTTTITRVKHTCHNISWPIKDIRFPILKRVINSPVFRPLHEVSLQFMLQLEPLDTSGDIRVSICLSPVSVCNNCTVHLKTALVDIFEELEQVRSFGLHPQLEWNEVAVLKRDDHENILKNDMITFYCEVTLRQTVHEFLRNEYSGPSVEGLQTPTYQDLANLSANLKTLYESGKFSDLSLDAGGKKFKLHRAVLSTRAPKLFEFIVQRGMRIQRMALTTNSDGTELDEGPDVWNSLLLYVYSARVEITDTGAATKLYLAASKYELALLKKKCLDYIKTNITF